MAAENFKVKKGLEVGTGITANSDGINVTGIITATQYRGDGSGLTGVVASGTGIVIKEEGTSVGTAGTINFVGNNILATLSEGTATVTVNSGAISIGQAVATNSDVTFNQIHTDYANNSGQVVRNIYQATSAPSGSDGQVGDLWILYS